MSSSEFPISDVMMSDFFFPLRLHLNFFAKFFVPGYAVPLISTVGINGKVYFMDKTYEEPGNTTGSYELDPSLVNSPNWADAWRRGCPCNLF